MALGPWSVVITSFTVGSPLTVNSRIPIGALRPRKLGPRLNLLLVARAKILRDAFAVQPEAEEVREALLGFDLERSAQLSVADFRAAQAADYVGQRVPDVVLAVPILEREEE